MKASDLRIGNLVEYHARKNKWMRIKIQELDIEPLYRLAALYRPIPITQEWLDKSGLFNKYGWLNTESAIQFRDQVCCLNIGGEECIYISHVQYVHQLQNLYHALTGKELKIKG